jgi:Tfp pilus assembly protein PilF
VILAGLLGSLLCAASWSLAAPASADSFQQQFDHAAASFEKGDLKAAEAAVKKALHLNPNSVDALRLSGRISLKGRKPDSAAEEFTRALRIKPADAETLNDLAEVYLAQGKAPEAEQTLLKAIQADPSHAESYLDLAKLYESRRDVPAATKLYQSLLAVQPTQADALFHLAVLQDGAGDAKGAKDTLAKLTKAHPKHADGWYQIGRMAERRNDLVEAAYAYKQAGSGRCALQSGVYLSESEQTERGGTGVSRGITVSAGVRRGAHEPGRGLYQREQTR